MGECNSETCSEHANFAEKVGKIHGMLWIVMGLLSTLVGLSLFNGRNIGSINTKLAVLENNFLQSRDSHTARLDRVTSLTHDNHDSIARLSLVCCGEMD